MQRGRTEKAVRNIIWGVIQRIVAIFFPFITRTVLIKKLGVEYLGLSSLFTSILTVLSISELGFGSAIVFSMYKPAAEKDTETLCALLNLYRKIYRVVGTIILIGGLLATPFLRLFIQGDYPGDVNLYILYFIYLFNSVISYFLFSYKGVLFASNQRNDIGSKIATFISLLSNTLQLFSLLVFGNYYVYVIILPIGTIVTNLANGYISKKMYPDIVCCGNVTKEMKNSIKKRVTGLVSFKIYGVIFNSVDTIVISSFLGLKQLAIYNNYYYVHSAILGFLNIISAAIVSGIGNKMVTDSVDENYKDFKKFTFANMWLVSWCSICMLCLYQNFIELWVGPELLFPMDTMILMVMLFFLPRFSSLSFTYREAAGLWWEDRFRPLVSAVANFVLNLMLVQLIGMNGVIISTLFCTVFINVPWGTYILFKNYFKKNPRDYFIRLLVYIIVFFGIGLITFLLCNLLQGNGVIYLLLRLAICIVVPNVLLWFVYCKTTEFEYFKQFVTNFCSGFLRKGD